MAIQHRVHGADRRQVHHPDSAGAASRGSSARPSSGYSRLSRTIARLDLERQPIGLPIGPAAAIGEPFEAAVSCSGRRSCSRSCARSRTRGTAPPSSRPRAGGRQTGAARPSRDTPSKALPSPQRPKVSPMCSGITVTHLSGRTHNMSVVRFRAIASSASAAMLMCVSSPEPERVVDLKGHFVSPGLARRRHRSVSHAQARRIVGHCGQRCGEHFAGNAPCLE